LTIPTSGTTTFGMKELENEEKEKKEKEIKK
jgi:hypothetical protein